MTSTAYGELASADVDGPLVHTTSPAADHDAQQAIHEAGALCILAERHVPEGAAEVPAHVVAAVTALLDAEANGTSPCEECESCIKGAPLWGAV